MSLKTLPKYSSHFPVPIAATMQQELRPSIVKSTSQELPSDLLAGTCLVTADVVETYPCSPLQEGVLLSSSSSYAVYWVWRCVTDGQKVDCNRLESAWRAATSRHAIYSTIIRMHHESSTFMQIVLAQPCSDVLTLTTESECPEQVLAKRDRPTFTATKPKHVFTICRSSKGNVACRFDICHTLYDVYSLNILLGEVLEIYNGRELRMPPRFSSVISHIARLPRSETTGYWESFLKGAQVTRLPVLPASTASSSDDDQGNIQLPAQAFDGVTEFCQVNGITRSVFMHMCWGLVLSYYTGSNEVSFGYMASGRDAPVEGIDRICGPMANLVISRVNLDNTFAHLAKSTGAMLKEQRKHQQTAMASVLHTIGLSGEPLFNTMVNLLRTTTPQLDAKESFSFEKHALVSPHEVSLTLLYLDSI